MFGHRTGSQFDIGYGGFSEDTHTVPLSAKRDYETRRGTGFNSADFASQTLQSGNPEIVYTKRRYGLDRPGEVIDDLVQLGRYGFIRFQGFDLQRPPTSATASMVFDGVSIDVTGTIGPNSFFQGLHFQDYDGDDRLDLEIPIATGIRRQALPETDAPRYSNNDTTLATRVTEILVQSRDQALIQVSIIAPFRSREFNAISKLHVGNYVTVAGRQYVIEEEEISIRGGREGQAFVTFTLNPEVVNLGPFVLDRDRLDSGRVLT